ncbi:uncharacterized protein Z520_06812 [Fonsecaea multimorphosa CBS 102226]|uniref:F-box domain-containing protein n=1 Tax=Fonsecaea multimorphosa CBS 102226 TaxID=1442371 RepID=A0A0D2H697_9EURO|nr:uncharacterized protein Z520_06812 [Fonsecaea multimorphosa CBS 102226]KIX97360.1 hypothetical protein Z520_06812 [Fonsecaea multimorphosa CBS 102226]OAL23327.1 hypothetical protein AYO22_06377 [Fonsecaea multimorphosa]
MVSWFQLPAEIRSRVYEYAFGALVFKPLQPPDSATQTDNPSQTPSTSFASLAVCRKWKREVAPYLLSRGTFDFTGHPGDPPHLVCPQVYEIMRQVVILETHCFSTDWLHHVLDKMAQVQTVTIRKLRKTGPVDNSVFDGPKLTQGFIERVKCDPIKTLLTGYLFDHIYIKKMLTLQGRKRSVLLEGRLWLADNTEDIHSVREILFFPQQMPKSTSTDSFVSKKFAIDLDSWRVRIEGVLEGATVYEVQAAEPAPVKLSCFDDEEGMFEYLISQHISQHWTSSRHVRGTY